MKKIVAILLLFVYSHCLSEMWYRTYNFETPNLNDELDSISRQMKNLVDKDIDLETEIDSKQNILSISAYDVLTYPRGNLFSRDAQNMFYELDRIKVDIAGDTMTGDLSTPNVNVSSVTFGDGTVMTSTIGLTGTASGSYLWIEDAIGGIMPSATGYSTSDFWTFDDEGNIRPK